MGEWLNRRNKFFDSMKENSVAIFYSGISKVASLDAALPFCVNKNFYYLTNIGQEDSILMMVKGIGEKHTYLFVSPYDELKEKWTGKRLTMDQASHLSEVENVYSVFNFESMLDLAISKTNGQYGFISLLYMDLSKELKIKDSLSSILFKGELEKKYPDILIEDACPLVSRLREIKSTYEIERIVDAINATNSGIANTLSLLSPGKFEYEVANDFEFYGRQHGRRKLAFDTIVASGKHATCLHYPTQDDKVKQEDLIQFDLGYRDEEYCADISRAYPVNGVFTGRQKDVYEAVLNCNKAVIGYIRAGMTIMDLQNFTIEFLKKECIRLKLMKENDDIHKYYFHCVSHYLGLDTHDVGDRNKPLVNGNVITVEPGLYFENYGIGVRIEDDVLIMDNVAEVLSRSIKKEIPDIEKMFKTRR